MRSCIKCVWMQSLESTEHQLFSALIPDHDNTPIAKLPEMIASAPEFVKQAFSLHLQRPLGSLGTDQNSLHAIGTGWLGAAFFLLDLFVTNIPIDPAVRRAIHGELLQAQISLADEEMAAIEFGEKATKGVTDSRRLADCRERLGALRKQQETLDPPMERSSDVSRLTRLFDEVHRFLQDQMNSIVLSKLLVSHEGVFSKDQERLHAWQAISLAFVLRLEKTYFDLEDLVRPIAFAIWMAKLGLHCIFKYHNSEIRTDLSALLSFPLAGNLESLQHITLPSHGTSQSSVDILTTTARLSLASTVLDPKQLGSQVFAAFTSVYSVWSTAQERADREAADAQSLYRVRKVDAETLTDIEVEAKELNDLFPVYEEDGEALPRPESDGEQTAKIRFAPAWVERFYRSLVACTSTPMASLVDEVRADVDQIVRTVDLTQESEENDMLSLALQIRLLHRREDKRDPQTRSNFYTSANRTEILTASAIVDKIIIRLHELIDAWPEQMVLQHIRDRCLQIMSMNAQIPLAAMLAALEGLLVHIDDWETYASRDNSLRDLQSQVAALVISWRRLELSSWASLLDDQHEAYIKPEREWALRLFGALFAGATEVEGIDHRVKTLLPMLWEYIATATLGSYSQRLEILRLLEILAIKAAGSGEIPEAGRIATLLHNLSARASLYSNEIQTSFQSQKATIDKEIHDYVKQASWKDVNVYALRASAQKSHRHLYRCVRKFRDILRQPVAPLLTKVQIIFDSPSEPASLNTTSAVTSEPGHDYHPHSPPENDSDRQALRRRFRKIHLEIRRQVENRSESTFDDMATEILSTSAELAKATPSALTKANAKLVNNLASRKRKAFSDLLKSLREQGFSASVRADQLFKQQSQVWMAGRPQLSLLENLDDLPAIDRYHHKTGLLMETLRSAFNGHHPDIASPDLQRGIGFTESLFASALRERDR